MASDTVLGMPRFFLKSARRRRTHDSYCDLTGVHAVNLRAGRSCVLRFLVPDPLVRQEFPVLRVEVWLGDTLVQPPTPLRPRVKHPETYAAKLTEFNSRAVQDGARLTYVLTTEDGVPLETGTFVRLANGQRRRRGMRTVLDQ